MKHASWMMIVLVATFAHLGHADQSDEAIVHHHDLPTELGLTAQDFVFKSPRQFRSRELNQLNLDESDPGSATQDESISTLEPLTDKNANEP